MVDHNDKDEIKDDKKCPFMCSHCRKEFKYKRNMMAHERLHRNEAPFNCCGTGFSSADSLLRHKVRAHGQKKTFKCSRCSKKCATNAYLKAHKHREEKLTAFSCDKCPFRAIQRAELNKHLLTHTTQKGQVCRICGIRFKHKASLRRHINQKHRL